MKISETHYYFIGILKNTLKMVLYTGVTSLAERLY
ncbi:hypothetical protein RCH13_000835 [Chryseobacterium sp. MP_3.2]|nr:hypothetical protein [Chryseobacterium sp. MP_3.2]